MPSWRKSSLSYSNGACVEVASLPGGQVGVRNSRHPAGLVLRFTPDEWFAFLGGVRNGEFARFNEGPEGVGGPEGTVGLDSTVGLHIKVGAG
jgi:hypothetical protein